MQPRCARLEQIADDTDVSLRGKTCYGMKGLIEEGKEAIGESDREVLDAR
jgi:ferritin-like metal-binding protein YciE